jgi:hypothetical protein
MVQQIKKLDVFTKLLKEGIKHGHVPIHTKSARDWFRSAARNIRANPKKLISSGEATYVPEIGKFYLFEYDAKLKEELPYWDRMPVILILNIYDDGFLGCNFHYLPYFERAGLMDALYSIANIQDTTTRLKVSYELLNNASQFNAFKPCVKRYLASHVKSPLLTVSADKWDILLFLDVARFQKASNATVWQDSIQKIHKQKKRNVWYRRLWRKFTGKKK